MSSINREIRALRYQQAGIAVPLITTLLKMLVPLTFVATVLYAAFFAH